MKGHITASLQSPIVARKYHSTASAADASSNLHSNRHPSKQSHVSSNITPHTPYTFTTSSSSSWIFSMCFLANIRYMIGITSSVVRVA